MEILGELAMDDPIFMGECDIMDFFDEDFTTAFGDDFQNSISPKSNSTLCAASSPQATQHNIGFETQRPTKKHKIDSFSQYSSSPIILDFERKSSVQKLRDATNIKDDVFFGKDDLVRRNDNNAPEGGPVTKRGGGCIMPPSQTSEHSIAERKRREKLSQRFIALSSIIPGLKKMDKISILGETIKYMKQLQETIKTLEEQTTKTTMESVVLIKKSHIFIEDEGSSDENSSVSCNESLPEIEVKLCDKIMLLKIHCDKHEGMLVKLLSNIENMNMSIAKINVVSFGPLALDITIIAEIEKEFNMTVKDIVRSIRSTLLGVI